MAKIPNTEPANIRPADIAIMNATILPLNGAAKIERGSITLTGNTVTAVGPADAVDVAGAKRTIDASGRVVMPGFVNCHTHIASNMLLRGFLEDVQLFEWLSTMWRLKQNFDEETLYWAGLAEMAKAGITTFNEHFDAYRVEPEIAALDKIPLRATLGYGFADRGLYHSITDWSWRTLHAFGDKVSRHHRSGSDRVHVALSPHAPYSCGADMYRLVRRGRGPKDRDPHPSRRRHPGGGLCAGNLRHDAGAVGAFAGLPRPGRDGRPLHAA